MSSNLKLSPLALFNYQGNKIFLQDILAKLKAIKIKSGDNLMVHSGLKEIGKLASTKDVKKLGNLIIDSLLKAIYPGTLISPTYTYSFCKNQDFNPTNNLSNMGSLVNIFWKRKDSLRSSHPIFSVAAIGKRAKYFTKIEKNVSLGKNSFFEKLVKENVKILGFGIKLLPALTLLHHIEKTNAVPYRYNKIFSGRIIVGNKKIFKKYNYFVRKLELEPELRLEKIEKFLKQKNALFNISFGGSCLEVIESKKVFNLLSGKLKKDPYWMIKLCSI